MRRAVRILIFVACVFFSVAGAYNVMSDNLEVERLAGQKACGDQGASCSSRTTRMERTPIAQTFEIATTKRTVNVRCTRALVFVGDYDCVVR